MAEYFVKFFSMELPKEQEAIYMAEAMNKMAKEGWRVVCVHSDGNRSPFITFVKNT